MARRLLTVLLALALAFATMGQESCESEPNGGDETTTEQSEAEREAARERKREKRREKRRREQERREQAPPAATEETTPPEQSADCEPGYDPCVPPYPPDLDCSDVGPVTVTGSDPHGLDADGDGAGCE